MMMTATARRERRSGCGGRHQSREGLTAVVVAVVVMAAMSVPHATAMRGQFDAKLGAGQPSYMRYWYKFGFEKGEGGGIQATIAHYHAAYSLVTDGDAAQTDELSDDVSYASCVQEQGWQSCSGQQDQDLSTSSGHGGNGGDGGDGGLEESFPAGDGVSLTLEQQTMATTKAVPMYGAYMMACPKYMLPLLARAAGTGQKCANAVMGNNVPCSRWRLDTSAHTVSVVSETQRSAGMRHFVLIVCDKNFVFTISTKFSFTNPTNRHLGSEWKPMPTILFIIALIWVALVLFVVLNSACYKLYCTPLHLQLGIVMGIKVLATAVAALSWSELDKNGTVWDEGSRIQTTAVLAMLLEGCWQACIFGVLMFASKGYMITRVSVISADKCSAYINYASATVFFVMYLMTKGVIIASEDDANVNVRGNGDGDDGGSSNAMYVWLYMMYGIIAAMILTSCFISLQDLNALMDPIIDHPSLCVKRTPAAVKQRMFRCLALLTMTYSILALFIKEMSMFSVVSADTLEKNMWLAPTLHEVNTGVHAILLLVLFRLRRVNPFNVIVFFKFAGSGNSDHQQPPAMAVAVDTGPTGNATAHRPSLNVAIDPPVIRTGSSPQSVPRIIDNAAGTAGAGSFIFGASESSLSQYNVVVQGLIRGTLGLEAIGVAPWLTYNPNPPPAVALQIHSIIAQRRLDHRSRALHRMQRWDAAETADATRALPSSSTTAAIAAAAASRARRDREPSRGPYDYGLRTSRFGAAGPPRVARSPTPMMRIGQWPTSASLPSLAPLNVSRSTAMADETETTAATLREVVTSDPNTPTMQSSTGVITSASAGAAAPVAALRTRVHTSYANASADAIEHDVDGVGDVELAASSSASAMTDSNHAQRDDDRQPENETARVRLMTELLEHQANANASSRRDETTASEPVDSEQQQQQQRERGRGVLVEISRRNEQRLPNRLAGLLPLGALRGDGSGGGDAQRPQPQLIVIANPPSRAILCPAAPEKPGADGQDNGGGEASTMVRPRSKSKLMYYRRICDFAVGAVMRASFLPCRIKPKAYTTRVLGKTDLYTMVSRTRYKVRRSGKDDDGNDDGNAVDNVVEQPLANDGSGARGARGDAAIVGGDAHSRRSDGDAVDSAAIGSGEGSGSQQSMSPVAVRGTVARWRSRSKVEPTCSTAPGDKKTGGQ